MIKTGFTWISLLIYYFIADDTDIWRNACNRILRGSSLNEWRKNATMVYHLPDEKKIRFGKPIKKQLTLHNFEIRIHTFNMSNRCGRCLALPVMRVPKNKQFFDMRKLVYVCICIPIAKLHSETYARWLPLSFSF